MGRLFLELLDDEYVYCCRVCKNLLTTQENYVSDAFQGSSGKAYLFKSVDNIICSHLEEKTMTTGKHAVRDVFCKLCQARLGWTYELAYPNDQRYKEGQYILEQNFIERVHGVATKKRSKDRSSSSSSSSPSDSIFNPMRHGSAAQFAIANSRYSASVAYPSDTFNDLNRFMSRAVAYTYNNDANQRMQSRHSARLRRAHLPS